MASQEVAHSNVGFAQREHDILSLLSIFVHTSKELSAGLHLLGTVLDDRSFYMPSPVNQGGYFEVYILSSKEMLDAGRISDKEQASIGTPLPETVAVKCPKIRGKLNDRRNQKLWTSMAMELQILKHDIVKDHDNIVKLLGVSWRSIKGTHMPAFVLEAARSDLYSMVQSFQFTIGKMSTRKILGLAVDISSGLSALHDIGIIHGDVKPQNILIFEDQKLGFVAKLTDFGSSLLKTDIKEPILLPYNTDIWQAPECQKPLDGSQLIQADTFSLGLVISYMLSRGYMLELFKGHSERQDHEEPLDQYDRCPDAACAALKDMFGAALEAEEEKLYGPMSSRKPEGQPDPEENVDEFDENEGYVSIRKIQRAVIKTILPSLFRQDLRPSSKSMWRNIRVCLSWLLRRDTFYPIFSLHDPFTPEIMKASKCNDQETDVIQNPDGMATEDDKERVWKYATTMEWLDRSLKTVGESTDIPSLDDVSQSDAAHRIPASLKTWAQSEAPKPKDMRKVRAPFAVLEAGASFGTLRFLPANVLNQIIYEMQTTAHNVKEHESRRAEAAWQCSIYQMTSAQVDEGPNPHVDPILELMLLAANLGQWKARSMCGWLYHAFGRPFPVSEDVEIQWLHDSVCKGSATARHRLASLKPEAYARAVDDLKRRHAGCGVELPQDWHIYDDEDFLSVLEHSPRRASDYLQLAATCGRLSLLRTILQHHSDRIDINAAYTGGETVLLKACRSGHFDIALYLLDHGADASVCCEDGVAPLHFLSAFEDDQISIIADKLIAANGSLLARSNDAWIYRSCSDATFGMVDGTPLTWAVKANNEKATQALVDLGADPFDIAGRTAKYGDGWSNNSHTSPVWTAAVSFQHNLLEILLKKAGDCSEHLNYASRKLGNQGLMDPYAVLGWVVNGCEVHGIRRLLLHGSQFPEAFQKTFDILLQHGADPFNVDSAGLPVFRPAIQWGQPYILNRLIKTQGGKFKPSTSEWSHGVMLALALRDNITLHVLLNHSQADSLDADHWQSFFSTTKGLPDNVDILNFFRKYRDSDIDLFPQFGNALLAGKYNLAKWLYQTGKCDLTTMVNGKSLLGRLINASKVYRNAGPHITALLSLNPPDAVYYNVMDFMGSKLTALQAVVFIQEYKKGFMSTTDILQAILRKKTDPEYLNLIVEAGPWEGKTALHLAVETCNLDAVQYLIDAKGRHLDFSTLDKKGFSLIDEAGLLMANQKSNMDVYEVPQEKRRAVDLRHFENAMVIIRLLYRTKLAKPNKLSMSLTRVELDELQVMMYGDEEMLIVPCKIPDLKRIIANEKHSFENRPESSDGARRTGDMVFKLLKEHGLKLELNDSVFGFAANFEQVDKDGNAEGGGNSKIIGEVLDQEDGQNGYSGSDLVSSVKNLAL